MSHPLPHAPIYLIHPLNGHVCMDVDEAIAYYEEHYEPEETAGALAFLRTVREYAIASRPE